jgi:hypothetical protein
VLERGEVVGERAGTVEILQQPPPPGGRQLKGLDQRREQLHVSHADGEAPAAGGRGALHREREDLGVRRLAVVAPERFHARLQELGGAVAGVAEYRPGIAVGSGPLARVLGEVLAADRDREIGPQAKLAAPAVRGEEQAATQLLAGELEKDLGRLQCGRIEAHVPRALVERHQRVRACPAVHRRRLGHDLPSRMSGGL